MSGLEEGCKEPYSQQVDCVIKLPLTRMVIIIALYLMPQINRRRT